MTDQKYTYRDQAQEILDYIKANPGVSTEGIVSGTGWNRHLVEVAVKLMVEQGLVKEIGQTDWLDFKYEAIDRDSLIPTRAEQIIAEVSGFIGNINQDLRISTPSGLFGPSPIQKLGYALAFRSPFSDMIAVAVERQQLLTEIAAIANLTTDEVKEFYQTHPYSLEFIKAAIQAGAKLDEEDIKRTMERRPLCEAGISPTWLDGVQATMVEERAEEVRPGWFAQIRDFPPTWADIERAQAMMTQEYTFIVILPNNDRREVKAAYMEVDGGSLYFEDEDHETILAFGPGHWVWAERIEGESDQDD